MAFFTRDDWGARAPTSTTRVAKSKRTGATIHHTTGSSLGRDDCAAWVQAIQQFHMDDRGWDDIGYQRLACRHGDVFEGRAFGVLGAHARGHNTSHVGICAMGDLRRADNLTDAMLDGLVDAIEEAERWAGHDLVQIGHGQHSGASTACPGRLASMLPLRRPSGGGRSDPGNGGSGSGDDRLVLPAKPVITTRETRPPRGGDIERETTRVQVELRYVHGIDPGPVDGWPGQQTAAAVRRLQERKGARLVDGIPGPETWPMILG